MARGVAAREVVPADRLVVLLACELRRLEAIAGPGAAASDLLDAASAIPHPSEGRAAARRDRRRGRVADPTAWRGLERLSCALRLAWRGVDEVIAAAGGLVRRRCAVARDGGAQADVGSAARVEAEVVARAEVDRVAEVGPAHGVELHTVDVRVSTHPALASGARAARLLDAVRPVPEEAEAARHAGEVNVVWMTDDARVGAARENRRALARRRADPAGRATADLAGLAIDRSAMHQRRSIQADGAIHRSDGDRGRAAARHDQEQKAQCDSSGHVARNIGALELEGCAARYSVTASGP